MTKLAQAIGIGTIISALYIMINHLGLIDGLDFGAGAYYYADIPEFQKFLDAASYQTQVPFWVFLVLFFGWGALMYKLWIVLK